MTACDVHGMVFVDKPTGISSNQVVQKVKRLFQAKKTGHTGSLDPIATGLLPICLGKATRLSRYLLDAEKTYEVICNLGQTTDTGDRAGSFLEEKAVKTYSEKKISTALDALTGPLLQTPPMFSAIKQQGKPLYQLAREGKTVERKPRAIHIYSCRASAQKGVTIALTVHCSKGTYIRVLVEDFGRMLGCGAHVGELRRTGVGTYRDPTMVELVALEHMSYEKRLAYLMPPDSMVNRFSAYVLDPDEARRFCHGEKITVHRTLDYDYFRVYSENTNCFLGIGRKIAKKQLAPQCVLI